MICHWQRYIHLFTVIFAVYIYLCLHTVNELYTHICGKPRMRGECIPTHTSWYLYNHTCIYLSWGIFFTTKASAIWSMNIIANTNLLSAPSVYSINRHEAHTLTHKHSHPHLLRCRLQPATFSIMNIFSAFKMK